MLSYVPHVPSYPRCLTCLYAICVYVPYVPAFLRAFASYVPFLFYVPYVPSFFTCLLFLACPMCLCFFTCHTCPHFLHISIFYVPYVPSIFMCLPCPHFLHALRAFIFSRAYILSMYMLIKFTQINENLSTVIKYFHFY